MHAPQCSQQPRHRSNQCPLTDEWLTKMCYIIHKYACAYTHTHTHTHTHTRATLAAQLVKNSCNAGNPSSTPGSRRSAEEGIGHPPQYSWTSLVVQLAKNLPAMRETPIRSLGWEDPLEKGRLPTPVFWPGLHSPWGLKESDTERLSLS